MNPLPYTIEGNYEASWKQLRASWKQLGGVLETIRRREALSAELPLLPAVRAARMGTSPNLQFDSPFQRKSGYIFLCVLKGNLDKFFFVFQWESG